MLALIAGTGALPGELVARLPAPPLVCALEGNMPDNLPVDVTFSLETLGALLATLRDKGVRELCMAGAVGRPAPKPQDKTSDADPLERVVEDALQGGDDRALRAAIGIFEQAGLTVRAAHEIAPDLLPPVGCATRQQPSVAAPTEARRAADVVAAMAAADVGQACAVAGHRVLCIEGAFGTDWMLQSLTRRPDGAGGILFKAPKPGQDRRVDLPVIGPATIAAAHAGGLDGVVIEAGGVMILDREAVLAECDASGLFLWVREPDA